ncbi:MAG TPA: SufE family protein [Trueperaceae bacterium]|nr:SufE family protein [Trueperaceae bacterium]
MEAAIPHNLQRIIDQFSSAPKSLRLPLLLEYAGKLPPLPPELEGKLERVHECQTPLFLKADISQAGTVALAFDAPPEAPTTRGFASIVSAGLSGSDLEEALATPEDFYQQMGLAEVISPLRLRGMGSIVARVKRQLREAAS